jgi:BON domain-containing protein
MKTMATFITGSMAGAAVTFLADPTLGRRRRALLRDAVMHDSKILARAIIISGRDTVQRAKGILEQVKDTFTPEEVDDAVLTDRIRTEIGRVCSHPNVEVIVEDRRVTLQGPVVAHERRPILRAARSVKGVCGINDRMEPYIPLPTMPTQASKQRQLDIMQRHWSPATRVLAGIVGGSMTASGIKSGTFTGSISAAAGLVLLLRGLTNTELKRLFGAGA